MPYHVIARDFAGGEDALRERSGRIVRALIELGITDAVGVPDNMTRIIFNLLDAEPDLQVVPVCREGEAWAIASGLWVGGRCPVVIIQNTGFFESGDGLRGTAIEMGVPLLVLMDYRGHHTLNKPNTDSAATLFEPTLRAWGLPYRFLDNGEEAPILGAAFEQAQRTRRPVAVLMT